MSGQASSSSTSSSAAGQSTVGTSGTKTTLNLTTRPGTELKGHANHKVEVTGTVAPAKSATAGASAGASSATATATANQEFTVESVKMVSATCP
jgi:hypothetical protein